MRYKISFSLRALLLVVGSLAASLPDALAQVQCANKVVLANGIVDDNNRAANGNLATNATIKPSLLLGYTRLRMSFPSTGAAG